MCVCGLCDPVPLLGSRCACGVCAALSRGGVRPSLGLHVLLPSLTPSLPLQPQLGVSVLLSNLGSLRRQEVLREFTAHMFPGKLFNLLLRGSTHGVSPAAFHSRCDGKGATLALIELEDGGLVGGYASEAWSSPKQGVQVRVLATHTHSHMLAHTHSHMLAHSVPLAHAHTAFGVPTRTRALTHTRCSTQHGVHARSRARSHACVCPRRWRHGTPLCLHSRQ